MACLFKNAPKAECWADVASNLSGMGAISSIMSMLKVGDHIVAMDDLYGGTKTYLKKVANSNMGINTTYVDLTDPQKVCT